MPSIPQLLGYLDELLQPAQWKDYCPNGLQVAGVSEITKIVTGVTASQALLDRAVNAQADAILVHHGYFWKHEDPCITGIKHKRLSTLLKHNINLIAYHLPLDAHPILGNNVQLAKLLNWEITSELVIPSIGALGLVGRLAEPMSGWQLSEYIETKLQRKALHIPGKSDTIRSIAWCTGGAQDFINEAVLHGVDAYLTGEISERTVHFARESGIHFYAAGHHATERYGVKALGEHLAEKFDLSHEFIDIDNPA